MKKLTSIFAMVGLLALVGCEIGDPYDDWDLAGEEAAANAELPEVVIAAGQSADWAHGLPQASAGYLNFDGLGQACGGLLIAPTLFLTNAHCVRDIHELGIASFSVGFGDYDWAYRVRGTRAVEHPDWNGVPGTVNDIGVIVMEAPLQYVPVASIKRNGVAIGSLLQLVGYGLQSDTDQNPDGVRKQALVTVITSNGGDFESVATTGLGCSGDSGSPLFLLGSQNVAVGLHGAGTTCSIAGRNRGTNLSHPSNSTLLESIGARYR